MKQVKIYIRILAAAAMLLLLAACGEESQSASSLPDLGSWVITRESTAPSEAPDSTARPVVVTEIPAETPAPTEVLQQNTGAETVIQPEQSQQPEQTPAVSQFAEIEEPPLVEKTDIDRSWLEGKIYGIEDTAGVSDEVKQKFVEFILTSDWFWDTCVDVPYQTEWFFENGAYGITLLVKVWNTDMQIDGDNWCDFEVSTLFLSGDKVMDGLRSSPVEIGTDLSTL